jgi:hypothetical protein
LLAFAAPVTPKPEKANSVPLTRAGGDFGGSTAGSKQKMGFKAKIHEKHGNGSFELVAE